MELESLHISEEIIFDEQLKMMFVCCYLSISENSQIILVLKTLCGFSITEISSAFFSTNETIDKRLVRGRRQLQKNKIDFVLPLDINDMLLIKFMDSFNGVATKYLQNYLNWFLALEKLKTQQVKCL